MEDHILSESEIKIEEDGINNEQYNSKAMAAFHNQLKDKKPRRGRPRSDAKHVKFPTPPSNPIDKTWKEYLKLENSLQTFYCTQCTFETKWKCYLKSHIKKIHADPEETQTYNCSQCNFKTKWKFSLGNHMKVHSSPGTVKMYKCPKCNYQTKWNNGLSSHMKVHMLPKVIKVNTYKCNECDFECKNKLDLGQHERMEHNPLQTIYKCPLCSFQTKFRHGVNKHVKVHNTVKLN